MDELRLVTLFRCGRNALALALVIGLWHWPAQTHGLIHKRAAQITQILTESLEPLVTESAGGRENPRSDRRSDVREQ
jgi:hypothetical protein